MQELPAKVISVILLIGLSVYGNAQSLNGTCASLYKERNLDGNQFILKDDAQVLNFDEEHISADDVWNQTLSFKVTKGCQINVCNETYFTGQCKQFSESQQELPVDLQNVLSASCACEKECKCSDINMRRTSCARAYFKPGCNVCNPSYTDLKGEKPYFSDDYNGKISAVKVRDGCSLTIYEEEEYEGNPTEINDTDERWIEHIGSYACVCNSEPSKAKPKPERPSNYPALLDMPSTIEEVSAMLGGEYAGHLGLLAAKKSLRHKRSSKNVYILTIGSTGAGKSSAINLLFDNPTVTAVGNQFSTTKDIHEFRIPVPIDELGINNSELRVIDTPGMGDTNGLGDDAKFLATLDDYLANHEELHNRIPNVVLIFHKFNDNRFSGPASNFVKMLRGFDSLRARLTDSKFSNVIFVLSHFCAELKSIRTRPNEKLGQFKAVIENYSQFPKPIMIVLAENKAPEQDLPMVNGYYKLPNGDFYPRNLFDKIQFATSNGGDPIGEAVITTGFRDSDQFNITSSTHRLANPNDKRITKYLDILTKAVVEIENTEISQLLAASYESMNATLKKTYTSGALYYLQKALSVRNIRTKSEIPKTTVEILTLVSSLKQNEAITYLLENALNIKPPMFPQNVVTGYSYNVFKDAPLSKSPYKLGEVINSDIGYLFPSAMTCNVGNQVKDIFEIKDTKAEYLKQRLVNLGIKGHLSEEKFTGGVKPGFNIKTESSLPDSCKVTAVREFRTFSLTLNDKPVLTPEFTEVIKNLPAFNESDLENVNTWKSFFDDYGTHVVKHVHGGGAIEIELTSNKACDTNISQTLIGLVQFAEDLTALTNDSKDALAGGNIRHHLTFKGGNQAYHTSDLTTMTLDASFNLMQNWKESLSLNPTILNIEMQLLPMSEVVKKTGQNISSEIQRATGLLFNSSLAYIPPRKARDNLPPDAREDTKLPVGFNSALTTMLEALVNQSRASEERFQKLIDKMREDQKESEKRRDEAHAKHLAYLDAQEKTRQANMILEKAERDKREKEREQKAKEYQAQREQDALNQKELEEKWRREKASLEEAIRNARTTTPRPYTPTKKPTTCLKFGTLIMLANGTEKPVQDLQVGELVMDHELNRATVLGVSSEFLMDQTFFGFDNESLFFTATHIFAGPLKDANGLQFYSADKDWLIRMNPLMEYIGVKDMGKDNFSMYQFDNVSRKLVSKSVKVYRDYRVYPMDTLVYYIRVDSPAGTYFANGYVSRHEVPPVEYWPNTMAILFSLQSNPDFKYFEKVPYTLTTVPAIYEIVSNIKYKIEDRLNSLNAKDLIVGSSKIEFDVESAELVLHSMYKYSSFSIFGMGLYNEVAPLMSKYLDNCNVNRCIPDQYLGSLQTLLREEISKEINKGIKSRIIPLVVV